MQDEMDMLVTIEQGVGSIIQDFAIDELNPDSLGNLNWEVKDGNLPDDVNGRTSTNYDTQTKTVTTTFDSDKFDSATNLAVARTILHEAIHAYVVSVQFSKGILSYSEQQDLLGSDWFKYSPFSGEEAHGFMVVNSYIDDISASLKQFGENYGYNLTSRFYKDLAWGGLTHTRDSNNNKILSEWFKSEVPNSSDRNRILNNIHIEQTGRDKNGNYKNQKGANSDC